MGWLKKIGAALFDPDEMTFKRLFSSGLCLFLGLVNLVQHFTTEGGAKGNLVMGVIFLAVALGIFLFRKSWLFR